MDPRLARLWKRWLEPIDWEAVAVERWVNVSSRWTRKGDKRPKEDVARKMESQRRNKRRRRREATEAAAARRKAAWEARVLPRGEATGRLLASLRPNAWHSRPEIRDASGLKYGSVKGLTCKLVEIGLLDRRDTGRRPVFRKGLPVNFQLDRPAQCEFRLTARGRAARAWWLAQKEMAGNGPAMLQDPGDGALDQQVQPQIGEHGERKAGAEQESD